MTQPVLCLENVTKTYGGNVAVQSLSLHLHPGEILGLLGPNGSGKTTTIRMITGLSRPDDGNIRVFGEDLADQPLLTRHRAGIVPDADDLPEDLTADEFLDFVAALRKIPKEQTASTIGEWIRLFGLEHARQRLLRGYSHGMKKKVQFAAALLHRPKLLILDEPTTGLDPDSVILLKQLLQRLRDKGTAILLSTHQLDFARDLCDRVCLIHRGHKLTDREPEELLRITDSSTLEEVYLKLTDAGRKAGDLDGILADW
ncbi:ABC transporter ATP-binding protein [Staphylospora marina]|uniref:ABC transporter ATP-binding protein n=1 Tax=Staphylospora marina TaxID=2490858 RepID=UPI0019D119AE|nr:ABC transporter ATP-binding protein [Staphylospora marina]